MLKMDAAYNAFSESILAALREIQIAMIEQGIDKISLGQGVPKRSHGIESKIVLVKMILQDGRIMLIDRGMKLYRVDSLDTDALHYLVSRIRGLSIIEKLIAK